MAVPKLVEPDRPRTVSIEHPIQLLALINARAQPQGRQLNIWKITAVPRPGLTSSYRLGNHSPNHHSHSVRVKRRPVSIHQSHSQLAL